MKRYLALLAALASAFASPGRPADAWVGQKAAASTTSQVLLATLANISATLDTYHPLGYRSGQTILNNDTLIYSYFPVAGNLTDILAFTTSTLTGSGTHTVTVYKNGSPTSLTCPLSSSSVGNKCQVAATVPIAAGDYVSILVHPTSNPNTGIRLSASVVFVPTTANDTVVFGQMQSVSNSSITSTFPWSNFTGGALASRRNSTVPDAGTFDKFAAIVTTAPGAAASGKKWDTWLSKNGAHATVTTQILETATFDQDTTHSFSVAGPSGSTPGDDIELEADPTSTPATTPITFSARYLPATVGSFWIGGNRLVDSASNAFLPVLGTSEAAVATESTIQVATHAMTITQIAVKVDTAAGAGNTKTYGLDVNGTTVISCPMTGAGVFGCTAPGTVVINEGDLLSNKITFTGGSPTAGAGAYISYLAHR